MTRSCTLSPCISQALYPILTVTMRTGNTALTKGMGKVLNPPSLGPATLLCPQGWQGRVGSTPHPAGPECHMAMTGWQK